MSRLWTVVVLAFGVSLFPSNAAGQQARVGEVRVHGNHTIVDDEVIRLADIAEGAPLTEATPAVIEGRLLASGRFAAVDVRVRFRSLDMSGDAVLVIIVRERTSLEKRWMLGPLFDFSDEYGFTVGAQLAVVDFPVERFRIHVPASWGGERSVGVEGILPVSQRTEGWNNQIEFGLRRTRTIHPHFELTDNRRELEASFVSRYRNVVLTGTAQRSGIDFDGVEDTMTELGVRAAFDTRRDRTIPGDAVYLESGFDRVFLGGARGFSGRGALSDVNRVHLEARGYKRLFGQTVLAAQLAYTTASGPLPPYAQSFLGGGRTLRGHEAGRFIGDQLALASLELRVPLNSTLAFGRTGIHFFYDTGSAFDSDTSLGQARFHHGVGVGGFFRFAVVGVRVDLGFDLEGHTRLHFGTQFKF